MVASYGQTCICFSGFRLSLLQPVGWVSISQPYLSHSMVACSGFQDWLITSWFSHCSPTTTRILCSPLQLGTNKRKCFLFTSIQPPSRWHSSLPGFPLYYM